MKLSFLGCGAANIYGNNSAFLKVENKGLTNMLLIDCGGKTKAVIKQTHVLKGVDQLIFYATHGDPDHINQAAYLFEKCRREDIEAGILLPPFAEPREKILAALKRGGVDLSKLAQITPRDAVDMMNFRDIDFRLINHHGPTVQCSALIMKKKTFRPRCKTVYATDHNDKRFFLETIQDEQLEMFYTDITGKESNGDGSHMEFESMDAMVPEDREMRRRICLMHMTPGMPERGKARGYLTADKFLYNPVLYKEKFKKNKHSKLRKESGKGIETYE